ncbi:hypothetical protein OAJ42_00875 [Flavobacteriales bacterium]|nr:hypothetical protein [Flavobacteriales bacterium]
MYFLGFFLLIFLPFLELQSQDYLNDWDVEKINMADKAKHVSYLNREEKNIYILINLARMYPKLFNDLIISKYVKNHKGSYDFLKNKKYLNSLSLELRTMSPLDPLVPDKELWNYAFCHASKSGKKGIVGHKRIGCESPKFYSECCAYGFEKALDIVVQLLIDYKVTDLGHRRIILDAKQKLLGVSIQEHKEYRFNAVLDFSYN